MNVGDQIWFKDDTGEYVSGIIAGFLGTSIVLIDAGPMGIIERERSQILQK